MGDCKRQMHSVNFREVLKSENLQMEKSSQSFMFEIQSIVYASWHFFVSCSSQSCQASRHGFVALAMSSWALSNSPKRFAAPGGCRKLFPLHAREFPDLFIRIHLFSLVTSKHSKHIAFIHCHPVPFSSATESTAIELFALVLKDLLRSTSIMSKYRNIEIWLQSYRKMIQ